HEVDGVREILPRTGDAADVGLPAELSFRTDLTRDTSDFGGEGVKLIDHRVDGVLELEDLALDVDSDLLRQIAGGHGLGDLCDVADLARQVTGHEVDGVRQIFPGPCDAFDVGLPAELSFGADFT